MHPDHKSVMERPTTGLPGYHRKSLSQLKNTENTIIIGFNIDKNE